MNDDWHDIHINYALAIFNYYFRVCVCVVMLKGTTHAVKLIGIGI